ncbi:N-acetylmuramic acid 6-phosphate etherase [Dactylosporangium maewongense]|uniref:N-acetylmuramic acid 6-phosphate etherase n=1 Tax=Dactylosporangium maewongense TaxID=634393 RepID=A0ABN2A7X7_9ACTN
MTVSPPIAPTEERNARSHQIDQLPTLQILELINAEDATVAAAVAAVLPDLAEAVDDCVDALRSGHRLHYFGAGTSGRMAVLDATELRPTYGVEPGHVVAHLAGGTRALTDAVEAAEDDAETGFSTAGGVLTAGDVALGVTASGGTPFVGGALRAARDRGARTVLLSANPNAALAEYADIHLAVDTGPEVVTGSTRMKAGTAQKLVLNALSTAVMVRLGRTYSNLMTDMVASNAKLRVRQVRMLVQATGLPADACQAALTAAGDEAKVALVTLLARVDVDSARRALRAAGGVVHRALDAL